jgi:uncharacterized membrane protein
MSRQPLFWVDPLMRLGYAARGVVYVLVGAFALIAAKDRTRAPDSTTALGKLLDEPFGEVMLGAIALGLAAYGTWRAVCAFLDLENKGGELKGWMARSAQLISALLHLSLAISAATLIWRAGATSGDKTEAWTAKVLAEPFGRWVIAIIGIIAFAIGVQHFVKAHQEKYLENLRYTPLAAKLGGVIKFGIVAHGVVVLITGVFFVWAAWTTDPTRAGGLADALNALRTFGIGQLGLAIVAAGLLGFSAYCFVEAIYRIVPRCAPDGLVTVATKAREFAQHAQRAVAGVTR